MSQSPFVKCCDCSFIAASQGHLGVHRSKMHESVIDANIKTVNIIRLFPEGKSHYCCLCNNIIASFPNFKRHFATTLKVLTLKSPRNASLLIVSLRSLLVLVFISNVPIMSVTMNLTP